MLNSTLGNSANTDLIRQVPTNALGTNKQTNKYLKKPIFTLENHSLFFRSGLTIMQFMDANTVRAEKIKVNLDPN